MIPVEAYGVSFLQLSPLVGCPGTQSFQLYAKVSFSVPLEGKRLENNFGPSVKLSDKKIQNGRQNPRWLPIFTFLSHYASTFLLLNTKS